MAGIVRVQRITLPRYEVEYATSASALEDARALRSKRVIALPDPLHEEIGAEVVVDLLASGAVPGTTLLFRIVQKGPALAALEWWARRSTDESLLELWIEALEAAVNSRAPSLPPGLPAEEQARLLELCRRALTHNPFLALGVHWTASPAEIERASAELEHTLRAYRARVGITTRGAELIDAALVHIPQTRAMLATIELRRVARARFVPRDQLRHARDLAATRLEVARLRGHDATLASAIRELSELAPPALARP